MKVNWLFNVTINDISVIHMNLKYENEKGFNYNDMV